MCSQTDRQFSVIVCVVIAYVATIAASRPGQHGAWKIATSEAGATQHNQHSLFRFVLGCLAGSAGMAACAAHIQMLYAHKRLTKWPVLRCVQLNKSKSRHCLAAGVLIAEAVCVGPVLVLKHTMAGVQQLAVTGQVVFMCWPSCISWQVTKNPNKSFTNLLMQTKAMLIALLPVVPVSQWKALLEGKATTCNNPLI